MKKPRHFGFQVEVPRIVVIPGEGEAFDDAQVRVSSEAVRQVLMGMTTRRRHVRQQRGREVPPIVHKEDEPPF